MPIVTISRQDGSGGDELARRLAKALQFRLVDKDILTRVAAMAHVPVEQVEEFADGRGHLLKRFLHGVARNLPDLDDYYKAFANQYIENEEQLRDYVYYGHAEKKADFADLKRDDCLKFFESAVRDLAERGKVILIGRGSQVLLRDFPHTLHVRIIASDEYRKDLITREETLDPDEAVRQMQTVDVRRARYLRANYDRDVDDPALYDLVIRMDKWVTDDVVSFLRQWVIREAERHEIQLQGGEAP